jgi:hypothetical protein
MNAGTSFSCVNSSTLPQAQKPTLDNFSIGKISHSESLIFTDIFFLKLVRLTNCLFARLTLAGLFARLNNYLFAEVIFLFNRSNA